MSITKLRWDDEYERCVRCGTRSQVKPHVAEGLCTDCFPQRYGDFGLGDVPPAWAEPGAVLPPAPAPVVDLVKPWHPQWPACLRCGKTEKKHSYRGICLRCGIAAAGFRRRQSGVALVWLPYSQTNPGEYDHAGATYWLTVRDLAEAATYLERRAAAGGIPTGGKVVIRATKDADRLPERVIRPVAA